MRNEQEGQAGYEESVMEKEKSDKQRYIDGKRAQLRGPKNASKSRDNGYQPLA